MRDTDRSAAGTISFIFVVFFLNMLSRLGLAPLLPGIGQELHLSHAAAGSLFLFVSVGIIFQAVVKDGKTHAKAPGVAGIRRLLATPAIRVLILLFSLALGGNQGVFSIMPLYLTTARQMAATQANHIL